jgi:hypothetical protein
VDEPLLVSLDLEITNQCRNECAMCPRDRITRPRGFMTDETLDRVIRELRPGSVLVTLSGMGDPLAHPAFDVFMGRLRSAGLDVGAVVHPASIRDAGILTRLLEAGPNQVTLSFPSVRREAFERLCPSISFDDALHAARRLITAAKGRCGVRVSGLATRLNPDEGETFKIFWKGEGIHAWWLACHGRGGHLHAPDIYRPGTGGPDPASGCSLLRYHGFVTWQGNMLACCHDLEGSTLLGNIMLSSLHDILSRRDEAARTGPAFSLCRACDEPLRSATPPHGILPEDRRARKKFFRRLMGR